MLIKLNQTQNTNYCYRPRSSCFPKSWQELLHVFFSLRIGGLRVLPRLALNHLAILQTPLLYNGPWYGLQCQVWYEAWKNFLVFFIWLATSGENPELNLTKYGPVLFCSFISLCYFQYSCKSVTSYSLKRNNKNKYFLSKRELVSLYLSFSVWKYEDNASAFPYWF